jgi:excisionase family DNA binding protein
MLPRRRKRKQLFTTGEIAAMVDTSARNVARWIDEGILKGVVVPGLKERRVHRDEVRAFFLKMEYTWAIQELDAIDGPEGDDCGGIDASPSTPADRLVRTGPRKVF